MNVNAWVSEVKMGRMNGTSATIVINCKFILTAQFFYIYEKYPQKQKIRPTAI